MPRCRAAVLLLALFVAVGCGGGADEKKDEKSSQTKPEPSEPKKEFKTVSLGNLGGKSDDEPEKKYTTEDVRRALNPLQVMVGKWGVTSRNKPALDNLSWHWDFSDRRQPALAFEAEKGHVVKSGKLTYYPGDESFQLVVTDAEDHVRTLDGEFRSEPQKVPGDDNKLHMTYKLTLAEATPPDGEKAWQITFNQQDNNQILFELEEKRGSSFVRFETLRNQRDGTSFARSFDDYGDRACIVSQGLGTMTVSYMGETYYVCCSGCESAFEEDPEYWIKKALERTME